MKKVFLVLGLLTLGLSSCKKDYTCECVGSVDGAKVPESAKTVTINDTESGAADQCDEGDIAETNGISVDCEIK